MNSNLHIKLQSLLLEQVVAVLKIITSEVNVMDKKRCYRCGEIKNIDKFSLNRARPDGVNTLCKVCSNEVEKVRRKENPEKYKKRDIAFRKKRPFYVWAQATLYKHKKKGFQIMISIKELEKIALNTKECPICECKLIRSNKKGPENNSPSLDRLDNGHTIAKDNIWIICHQYNKTKGERTLNEFIEYCQNVSRLCVDRDAYKGSTDTPQTAMMRTILTVEPPML